VAAGIEFNNEFEKIVLARRVRHRKGAFRIRIRNMDVNVLTGVKRQRSRLDEI